MLTLWDLPKPYHTCRLPEPMKFRRLWKTPQAVDKVRGTVYIRKLALVEVD
jgi:hypothetical protein